MIKAVFFDLYGTLALFHPPKEKIQAAACEEHGLNVSEYGLLQGYKMADDYMSSENSSQSIFTRSKKQQDEFFTQYEKLILNGAGIDASANLALKVWEWVKKTPNDLVLYDDCIPALEALKNQNLTIGLLSNLRRNLTKLIEQLGLIPYVDFAISSQEVGAEKPHAPIFLAALARAKVSRKEAMHVGDQYNSDIKGALGVGMRALLLDRNNTDTNDHKKVLSLIEVSGHIKSIR